MNYLLIESLQKFHYYLGDEYRVEYPTGSGQNVNLDEVAAELSRRLTHIFLRDRTGRRPVYGGSHKFQKDPYWRDPCFSMSISMATTEPGSGPATRPDGRDWLRS